MKAKKKEQAERNKENGLNRNKKWLRFFLYLKNGKKKRMRGRETKCADHWKNEKTNCGVSFRIF